MTVIAPPRHGRPAAARPRQGGDRLPSVLVGVAVLLASMPVAAVVQGWSWLGYTTLVVAVVVAAGLGAARFGNSAVAGAQIVALLCTLTALFTENGLLAVLPGPEALGEMGSLLGGAAEQIQTEPAPVPATPEMLFLIAAAVGVLAVAAYLAAVVGGAPATAGVPLLVEFAVPTAVADDLLPWWTLVAGAAAFGLLLVIRADRHRLPGAAAIVAGGVVIALLVGLLATFVGTDGRFANAPRPNAEIGLDPFTALRGQLTLARSEQLLEVRGLPRPTYVRALTLRDYLRDTGWQAGRPDRGVPLTGPLPPPPGAGERVNVTVDNIGYRDYWLPLYGDPTAVSGIDDQLWAYDPTSGTAYSARPREESGWEQRGSLPSPTAGALRAAGRGGAPAAYLDASQVDQRVREIAAQVTAGATTDFDRAIALLDWFTGPTSQFRYSLATAPGNGDDALVEFLTIGRIGYCEQFASAMAVMLRTQGVPARVAIGFTAGTAADGDGGARTISSSDAHAWVEVWFDGIGWVMFDPTPLTDGRTIVPPYVAEALRPAGPQQPAAPQQPGPAGGPVPAPAPAPPSGGDPDDGGSSGGDDGLPLWPFALAAAVVLAGLFAAVPAGWRELTRRRRLAAVTAGGAPAATAAWEELLAESVDRGVPGQRSDTVRGAARRFVRDHHLDEPAQASLREVVGAVEASWFGDEHPAPGWLIGPVQRLRGGIEKGNPLGWRRRLLPRSVTTQAAAAVRRRTRARRR